METPACGTKIHNVNGHVASVLFVLVPVHVFEIVWVPKQKAR